MSNDNNSNELNDAPEMEVIPAAEGKKSRREKRQHQQFSSQPYYPLFTPEQRQKKEQEYLQKKSLEIQEKYGINPMTAPHCELQDFYNTDLTAGVTDYRVHRSTAAMNAASRIHYDLCTYLYSCFIHFPNASKDWCLSLLMPPLSALGGNLSAAWAYQATSKADALTFANANLAHLHMVLHHLQQSRLLSTDQFMTALAKINGLSRVVREWRKLFARV